MTTEIEFKFTAQASVLAALPKFLQQVQIKTQRVSSLINQYYDTLSQDFRQQRAGLRVRSCQDQHEMTLKIAGHSMGGLHHRQEFNLSLDKPEPDLSQFPSDVQTLLAPMLAKSSQLAVVFSTNFERQAWLITYQQSEIELVCDRGEVVAGERSVPIQELELELVSGEVSDLFDFARQLVTLDGLRLCTESKAQRGYQLAYGDHRHHQTTVLKVPDKITVKQAFEAALNFALTYWHQQEKLALQHQQADALMNVIGMFRELLAIWGGLLPRKASVEVREALTALFTSIKQTTDTMVCTLIESGEYQQHRLHIIDWCYHQRWQAFIDAKHASKWAGSFKRFADVMLGRLGATLKALFPTSLTHQQYQDKVIKLQQTLSGLMLLSGAYVIESQAYIQAWQGLLSAIQKGQPLDNLHQLRQQALQQGAYWRYA